MSKKTKLGNLLRSALVFGVLLASYFNAYAAPKIDYKNIPDVIKDSSNAVGKIAVTNLKIVDEIKPKKIYSACDEAGNKVVLNLVGKISVSPEFAKVKKLKIGEVYAIFLKINEISPDKVVQGDIQAIAFPHEVSTSIAKKPEKGTEEPAKAEQKVAQTPQQQPKPGVQQKAPDDKLTTDSRQLPNNNYLVAFGTDSETRVNFFSYAKSPSDPCSTLNGQYIPQLKKWQPYFDIIGQIPQGVSLQDDKVARSLVDKGKNMIISKCGHGPINIWLVSEKYQVTVDKNRLIFSPILVSASYEADYSTGGWGQNLYSGKYKLTKYQNMALAKEQAKLEEEQAASISELGPQKAAEALLAQKITKCGNSHYTKDLDPGGYTLGLYEFKDLSIQIKASPLTEADKLNGIEWKGTVILIAKASRAFKVPGMLEGGKVGATKQEWLDWESGAKIDHQSVYGSLLKKKGRWHLQLQIGVMGLNLKPIKCSEMSSGG